jgi:short-subunit dehydrogenase
MRVDFVDKYGPWALVAGASMGIGAAFAHEAAARGLKVVMMARGEQLLRSKAEEVSERHGVETRVLVADLADPHVGDVVAAATADLDVGLFVHNGALAPNGRFAESDLALMLASVSVNCASPVILCRHFAPRLVARGRGGIGLVSSLGGMQGSVNFALYNAGKAFQWVLAETLWAELKPLGVDVNCIMVGATASPNYLSFMETLDPELCGKVASDNVLERARNRLLNPATPEQVATSLYDQLRDGPVCYAGPDDAWVAAATLALPREQATRTWVAVQETSTRTPDRQAV